MEQQERGIARAVRYYYTRSRPPRCAAFRAEAPRQQPGLQKYPPVRRRRKAKPESTERPAENGTETGPFPLLDSTPTVGYTLDILPPEREHS